MLRLFSLSGLALPVFAHVRSKCMSERETRRRLGVNHYKTAITGGCTCSSDHPVQAGRAPWRTAMGNGGPPFVEGFVALSECFETLSECFATLSECFATLSECFATL